MDELNKNIIRKFQGGLAPTSCPYWEMASRLGISEDDLLARINKLLACGVIRKIGAVLYHRRIGFTVNALCIWNVPIDQLDTIGKLFATFPFVTHCFERNTQLNWPYNLYTMIHATTKRACERYIHKNAQ